MYFHLLQAQGWQCLTKLHGGTSGGGQNPWEPPACLRPLQVTQRGLHARRAGRAAGEVAAARGRVPPPPPPPPDDRREAKRGWRRGLVQSQGRGGKSRMVQGGGRPQKSWGMVSKHGGGPEHLTLRSLVRFAGWLASRFMHFIKNSTWISMLGARSLHSCAAAPCGHSCAARRAWRVGGGGWAPAWGAQDRAWGRVTGGGCMGMDVAEGRGVEWRVVAAGARGRGSRLAGVAARAPAGGGLCLGGRVLSIITLQHNFLAVVGPPAQGEGAACMPRARQQAGAAGVGERWVGGQGRLGGLQRSCDARACQGCSGAGGSGGARDVRPPQPTTAATTAGWSRCKHDATGSHSLHRLLPLLKRQRLHAAVTERAQQAQQAEDP